jgi:glycosyltransferase involved in cell wall biosynthesis
MDKIASDRHWHPPLRIAMVVPPWVELPPPGYGGLEQVCAALIDALAARGHQVTLFGAGTRTGTGAELVSTNDALQYERLGQAMPELVHAGRVERMIAEEDFDIVHDHTLAGLLAAPQRRTATVATVHGPPTGEIGDFLRSIDRSVGLVAISYAQRRLGPGLPWTATVYNGLAGGIEAKPKATDGPVLWLARFNPDKGPDLAIRACDEAGLPLVLAGKCNEPNEQQYFDEVIKPMLHPGVELVMNGERSRTDQLLKEARCLLLPLQWEEPFGMVIVEAMAAGTPVVALNRGSTAELIRPGETGLICDDPSELADALRDATRFDPAVCAAHVRDSFSAELMASRYERVYRRWAATGPPARAECLVPPAAA